MRLRKEAAAWVVVFMTQKRENAVLARQALESEGFLSRMFPPWSESLTGIFEVKCLTSEARQARAFLTERGFF